MKIKKTLAVFLALAMVIAFSGCYADNSRRSTEDYANNGQGMSYNLYGYESDMDNLYGNSNTKSIADGRQEMNMDYPMNYETGNDYYKSQDPLMTSRGLFGMDARYNTDYTGLYDDEEYYNQDLPGEMMDFNMIENNLYDPENIGDTMDNDLYDSGYSMYSNNEDASRLSEVEYGVSSLENVEKVNCMMMGSNCYVWLEHDSVNADNLRSEVIQKVKSIYPEANNIYVLSDPASFEWINKLKNGIGKKGDIDAYGIDA